MQERIVLYAVGELDESAREEVKSHTGNCTVCAAVMVAEQRFAGLVESSAPAPPDANLLASCRARLSDSLDGEEPGCLTRWMKALFGPGNFDWRSAVTAALLVMVGFVAGRVAPWQSYLRRMASGGDPAQIHATTPVTDIAAMQGVNVAGITWTPGPDNVPPNVQVRLESKEPVVVQGTVNNDQVKDALLSVLRNGQRYRPDERLQSVELLEPRCGDDDVRQAMCTVLRTDHNPAVRLKALEALRGIRATSGIQQTLLQTLREDSNPGVRVEAINSLMALVNNGATIAAPDDMRILHDSMLRDSNNYVRLQSAAVLQDLNHTSGAVLTSVPQR
jgi:anti-sigma factor RsiW